MRRASVRTCCSLRIIAPPYICFFFFNDTATTEIYTLSLHDALPICDGRVENARAVDVQRQAILTRHGRSEEHTSELQSLAYLVCPLLLEKKKKTFYSSLLSNKKKKHTKKNMLKLQ